MSALERLKELPDWPARMTAPVAAAYMGVSQTTFLIRYGEQGRKDGGNTFWARAQLDNIVADQFGLGTVCVTPASAEDDYASWKARRGR